MSRPQTLAEVAQVARARAVDFAMALNEFTDEFYLDHPDKTAQQQRIDPVPELVGDARIDAWIGAAGEHLAQRWGTSRAVLDAAAGAFRAGKAGLCSRVPRAARRSHRRKPAGVPLAAAVHARRAAGQGSLSGRCRSRASRAGMAEA